MARMLLPIMLLMAASLAAAAAGELPFWPHYPTRTTTLLDGTWAFGLRTDIADATRVQPRDATTPNSTTVPGAFDVAPMGMLGPRGTAFYRTTMSIAPNTPAAIYFAACGFYCKIFVDGQDLGDHRAGGYQPFWVDVPPSPAASRELLVVVDNRFNSTTAPTTTGGDFYFYSGITRNVILHELPFPVVLRQVEVFTTDVEKALVTVRVVFASSSSAPSVDLQLSWNGQPAVAVSAAVVDGVATLAGLQVAGGQPWTFDSPQLSTLLVQLREGGDAILVRFGLRLVGADARSGRFTLNGKVTKLHGVNRHTMWPDTGSALTLAQVQTDVALLKELGVNFVRGGHYPQDQRFLDLCDEAGIGIWEETLGPGVKLADLQSPYFLKYQVQAVNEMISASINHPCVMFHGFYNEGPSNDPKACAGYNVSAAAIRARVGNPPSRLVTWASDKAERDVCLGIADVVSFNHYPGWYDHPNDLSYPAKYWTGAADWAQRHYPHKPFFISETGAGGVYEWQNSSDPFWSQNYQAKVVERDAQFAVDNDTVSGITVWQYCDIKANDGDTVKCGHCDYLPHPPSLSTPWDCGYISVSCSRPGGENHKGMVDFWRRKKQIFPILQKIYGGPRK